MRLDAVNRLVRLSFFLLFHRRWVVMDKGEKPIKVADKPSLAVVTPHFEDEKYLCLDAPGMDTLKLDLELPDDSKDIKDLMYDIFYRNTVNNSYLLFLQKCFMLPIRFARLRPCPTYMSANI